MPAPAGWLFHEFLLYIKLHLNVCLLESKWQTRPADCRFRPSIQEQSGASFEIHRREVMYVIAESDGYCQFWRHNSRTSPSRQHRFRGALQCLYSSWLAASHALKKCHLDCNRKVSVYFSRSCISFSVDTPSNGFLLIAVEPAFAVRAPEQDELSTKLRYFFLSCARHVPTLQLEREFGRCLFILHALMATMWSICHSRH